ncbi:MAG: hypothetical protein ACYDC1_21965, partial [Limisphaerales bacterium]
RIATGNPYQNTPRHRRRLESGFTGRANTMTTSQEQELAQLQQDMDTVLSTLIAISTSADNEVLAPGSFSTLLRLPEAILMCQARVNELRRLDRLDPANDDDGDDTNEDA